MFTCELYDVCGKDNGLVYPKMKLQYIFVIISVMFCCSQIDFIAADQKLIRSHRISCDVQ